jgi:drug/metabolite transporter (DMT)-like permease
MQNASMPPAQPSARTLHWLGVACGFGAGAWLGAAEAPTKLVTAGFSPFIISLGMVAGVFVARWTVPMLLKGTGYIWLDLKEKKHLLVWAVLAGMLWAVANTLTVFAIRNVGLSVAFPLWNTNSLVGLFWGWLLFNELRNSGASQWIKVLGGAAGIVVGACVLAYATTQHTSAGAQGAATLGILAALGAGLLWGTMYIPYRKAYISGMNPLSFVTVFTFGELGTVFTLALVFGGGYQGVMADLTRVRPVMFWLFLGGFCWVLGDLFQQYAAKYIGISRGIPLSNTNQLWGLAWGALVFGELAGHSGTAQTLIVLGSLVMVAGAAAISSAEAPQSEHNARSDAMERECRRYGLKLGRLEAAMKGQDVLAEQQPRRHWWEALVGLAALGIFIWLGMSAERAPIAADPLWIAILSVATLALLLVCGLLLWRKTRFS